MNDDTKQKIKQAFRDGSLKAKTVDPISGEVSTTLITDVLRHDASLKNCVNITLVDGRSATFTTDHSLFFKQGEGVVSVAAKDLKVGDFIITVEGESYTQTEVLKIESILPRVYMYDLSVPGPQNFMLTNGILAHNSYSIGGISLDIERSSKYEGLKSNAEGQFDKAAEAKSRTTKFLRGLKQPKYGVGIRSAFGPAVGRGVLSPRGFLILPFLISFLQILC